MKVVVIEDEKAIIDAVSLAFEFRWPDARVIGAMTGKDGVRAVQKESPDVVILDINLPDLSGFYVLKEIRAFSPVPVIILTVRADDEDVMRGLEGGADDYVIKPFNYLTLLARVNTVIRRFNKTEPANERSISVGSKLKIDLINQKVQMENEPVKLTPVEYRLLVLLAKNKDSIVSPGQIMQEIWEKDDAGDTVNIRVYIRRLREKLGDSPPNLILNKHGAGYMLKSK